MRQRISRALGNQSRSIRIPANVTELLSKIKKISIPMTQKLGRQPNNEELAAALNVEVDKVTTALDMSQIVASLDVPIGDDDDTTLGELQPDKQSNDIAFNLIQEANKEIINMVLGTLSEKEANVLKMRFGIDTDHPYTLDELGTHYGVSKERIRQLEVRAIKKLRNPHRRAMLQEVF